jgi:hypothetical protein
MDLTGLLLRFAARRPHVLVVPTIGGTDERLALEAELARRGWPVADAPADADVLAVAGPGGPAMDQVVDRVWLQVPAPRVRTAVRDAEQVPAALDAAAVLLADVDHQRSAAASTEPDDHHDGPEHGDHAPSSGAHSAHHDHHGGGMALPGGLAMADLGADRDGLTLDRLHVPLGPALPEWPAGLVLRVMLQGDVIQEAAAEMLDAGPVTSFWTAGNAVARELDALGRFLAVAGWADAAARARRIRDALLAGTEPERLVDPLAALVGRVRRSRTLAWLVRGIPAGPVDVAGLLERRLDAVHRSPAPVLDRPLAADLPDLLAGAELAAARLVVAALDPDTEQAATPSEVPRG